MTKNLTPRMVLQVRIKAAGVVQKRHFGLHELALAETCVRGWREAGAHASISKVVVGALPAPPGGCAF